MAIVVECPQCKTRAEVPNSAAGAKGKCRSCGAIVQVPRRPQKFCPICGCDLGGANGFKNETGLYYCDQCRPSRTAPVDSSDLDVLAAAAAAEAIAKPTTPKLIECPMCQGYFTFVQMDGSGICRRCAAQQRTADRPSVSSYQADPSDRASRVVNVSARRVGENEVVIAAPFQEAFQHVQAALAKIGKVKRRDISQHFIEGRIKFGLQSVKIRVSMVERGAGQTTAVIQGSSDDVWGAGAKNATKRLAQMLENIDNPGFKADRLGIHPLALIAVVLALFILIFLVVANL